jgi:hypothetical protein
MSAVQTDSLLCELTCRFDCAARDRYDYRIPITELIKLLLSRTKEQRTVHCAGKLISAPGGRELIPTRRAPKFPFSW